MSKIKTRDPGSEFQSLVPARLPTNDGQRRRRMVWSDDAPIVQEKENPPAEMPAEPIKEAIEETRTEFLKPESIQIPREKAIVIEMASSKEEELAAPIIIEPEVQIEVPNIGYSSILTDDSDLDAYACAESEEVVSEAISESSVKVDEESISPEDIILLNFYKKQASNKKRKPTNILIQEEIDRIKSYCAIPQWLSNAVNKLGLSTNPSKVLDSLIRLAINYKNLEVKAGYSILTSMSGVQKQNLSKAIAKLESLELVARRQQGYNEDSVYRIIFLEPFQDITFNPSLLRNQKDAKPAIDIPKNILLFIDRKNLSPGEREAAMEVTQRSLEEGVSAENVLRVYEYLYSHGMVGTRADDSYEGSKPKYPFRYLLKSFGFVLDRVNKINKKQSAVIVANEKREVELKADNMGAQEAVDKFNAAYPEAGEREEALKLLVASYRRSLPAIVKDINFPDSAAIIAWAQEN